MTDPGGAPPDPGLLQADLRLAGRLDARFFALLQALLDTGALQKAARAAGYSYKGAWLVLDTATGLAREPLVARATGGRGGGGTRLTPAGQRLLAAWGALKARHDDFLRAQEAWLLDQPDIRSLLRRLTMKTSARNQFAGTLTAVQRGPATVHVTLALSDGQPLTATMTAAAAAPLALTPGQDVIALVKSSEVVLVTDFGGWRLSAANQLAGTVARVRKGATTSLVTLTLPGGAAITASVTNDAVEALGLAAGQAASAVFPAYAVMLAVADEAALPPHRSRP